MNSKQFMASYHNGWKFYEGTGSEAKRIYYIEGGFQGTEIKSWDDVEAAVAVRNLTSVIQVPGRLYTFEVAA